MNFQLYNNNNKFIFIYIQSESSVNRNEKKGKPEFHFIYSLQIARCSEEDFGAIWISLLYSKNDARDV